jgi:hypothetical protein
MQKYNFYAISGEAGLPLFFFTAIVRKLRGNFSRRNHVKPFTLRANFSRRNHVKFSLFAPIFGVEKPPFLIAKPYVLTKKMLYLCKNIQQKQNCYGYEKNSTHYPYRYFLIRVNESTASGKPVFGNHQSKAGGYQ